MELHWTARGPADAPPVVCLHALGLRGTDWDPVVDALCDRYRMVTLDLPGHGDSGRADRYSFEDMADAVAELIDELGATVNVVGHSMGGTVAYLVTERHPASVASLVIEDTPPPRDLEMPEPPDAPPEPVDFDWRVVKMLVRQLNDPDPRWWVDLAAITVPTLLLAGGPDSYVPQELLPEVAERIPSARLEEIGGGHFIHQARPEQFVAVVRDFLDHVTFHR